MVEHREYIESRLSLQNIDDDRGLVTPKDKENSEFLDYIDGWKGCVVSNTEINDPRVFLAENAGRLQANLLSIAFESVKETTRLDATKYALEQAGYGAVKNVQVQHSYDTMPEDQLLAMVKAKFAKIKEALPDGVDIKSLLSDDVIDVDIISNTLSPEDICER